MTQSVFKLLALKLGSLLLELQRRRFGNLDSDIRRADWGIQERDEAATQCSGLGRVVQIQPGPDRAGPDERGWHLGEDT